MAPAKAFPEHKIKWMEGPKKPLLVAHPTPEELAAAAEAERQQREAEERQKAAAEAAIAAAIAAATAEKPEPPSAEDSKRTVSQDLQKILQQISSADLFGDVPVPTAVKSSTGVSASASSTSAGLQQPSSSSLPGTHNDAAGGDATNNPSELEPRRPLLPAWCTEGVDALSVISWSKGKELLEEGTWFDFFAAEDAPKLLQLCGVSVQVSSHGQAVPGCGKCGRTGNIWMAQHCNDTAGLCFVCSDACNMSQHSI